MVAALSALRVWQSTGKNWGRASQGFAKVPQKTGKIRVAAKPELETLPHLSALCREAGDALAGKGRVMLRYSGTEPVLRILVEAPTEELARNWYDRLASCASKEIGPA